MLLNFAKSKTFTKRFKGTIKGLKGNAAVSRFISVLKEIEKRVCGRSY